MDNMNYEGSLQTFVREGELFRSRLGQKGASSLVVSPSRLEAVAEYIAVLPNEEIEIKYKPNIKYTISGVEFDFIGNMTEPGINL